ncbi:phosphoribosylanthranilate isomerase [Yunchengibacter salinarum]|uniref:phosphoribosylanthranilate isomerase n=1 Tax=Yunchengibacter salinarum TaxID=3133399 RepID=UPI0035B5BEC3
MRVKICGITRAGDARLAASLGADFLGFIHFAPSPRHLDLAAARALAPSLPTGPERVGVFVDAPYDTIASMVDALDLDWVQLHGSESPLGAARIRDGLGVRVIKAFGIAGPDDFAPVADYAPMVDAYLFDAKPRAGDALPGGNARSFSWSLLHDRHFDRPWLLAGGLNGDNAARAVQESGAAALDISSGVEVRGGVKDPDRLTRFLSLARQLDTAENTTP